jgi:tetratricopeptide (TPR) repeat protein
MNLRLNLTRIFIAVIFLISIHLVGYTNENDSTVNRIFTLIYNQQFSDAEKSLEENINQLQPFYNHVLQLDLYWWKYSLSRSKEDAKKLNEILAKFTKTAINSREEEINELIVLSYQMRYEIKRYNVIGAYLLRSDARKRIEVVKISDLSFLGDRQKLFNLYLSLFDYFDNVVNPFSFGRKSDEFLESLQALEKYSFDNDLILSTMAHYYLGRIYTKVEKQPEKGLAHFKILAQRFPKNILFKQLSEGLNPNF